jgi:hypothetical protein
MKQGSNWYGSPQDIIAMDFSWISQGKTGV